MRVTFITVIALLTGDVIADKKLQNGDCHGHTLKQMSKQNIDTCAAHYDPTAVYPVWDESEDFSCRMCPPQKELLKLKQKKMSKNHQKPLIRRDAVQGRGIIMDAFHCLDCLVESAFACALALGAAVVCCPCITYALIDKCIKECT
ncbi:hypothetical protein CGRA01v4_09254 [Colletotrichum graminicola]|nr:hypothetical protein CGRA01v4_09254 [Colletotrichum graminicola]